MAMHSEIRSEILGRTAGSLFSHRDLLRFGERAAVDRMLSRLRKEGAVTRISRALYARSQSEDHSAARMAAGAVAAMARSENIKVQMSGRNAAYHLGLVDERPKDCVYLTTGASKRVSVGSQIVELRHDTSSAMLGAGTRAGTVISALRYLGDCGVTGRILVKLHRQLSPRTARELRRYRAYVPLWMRECIDALTATIG